MALCFLSPILVLLIYLTSAQAAFSLSSEVAKFIPACAQECFESFLDANYDESKAGPAPSLQFICSTKSASGDTAGEGAVSCIESEDNAKFCSGDDAAETVVAEAFIMCNGQPNALPNTRGAITATLIMETSGIVLISPGTTSRHSSHTSSSRATITSRATTSLSSVTGSRSWTATTATSSATELPPTQKSSQNPGLSKNQIVGISVAGVGGAGIAIAAMIVVVCLRRRRLSRPESDTLPFQQDPTTSQWWEGKSSPPPIPPRFDISPPNMFSRRSIPLDIGLAVSPDEPSQAVRRASPLLPDKPSLRLVVPAELPASEPDHTNRRQVTSVQSNVTQFEDDDYMQYEQTRSGSNPGKNNSATLDTFPPVPISKYYIPTQSAPNNTSNGNNDSRYMYRNPNTDQAFAPETDLYVKPLNVDRSGGGAVPTPFQNPAVPPQQRGLEVPSALRPLTQASSVYSQQTPYNGGAPFYNTPGTRQPSLNTWEGNRQTPRPTSYKQVGPYDRGSTSSLTSFESEASQGKKDYSTSRTSAAFRKSVMELSPVAGSPASGKSPVSYPDIPAPARLTPRTIKMVPPPPQPDFGSVFWSRPRPNADLSSKPWLVAETAAQRQRSLRRDDLRLSRATRPSPQVSSKRGLLPAPQIRGRWSPQPPMPGDIANQRMQYERPDEAYPLVQQQNRAGNMPPQSRMQIQPQGQQYAQPQEQQYAKSQGQQYPQPQRQQYLQPQRQEYLQPQREKYPQPQRQQYPQPQRQQHSQYQGQQDSQAQEQQRAPQQIQLRPHPQPQGQQLPQKDVLSLRPGAFLPRHSRSSSINSANSTSSSLLAKRLGAEKAAGLHLVTKMDPREKSRPGWRVLRQDEIEAAKNPGWKPQLLQQTQGEKTSNGENDTSSDLGRQSGGELLSSKSVRFDITREGENTPPPVTPGWIPKLTPTRKGDKLFLSVQ